MCTAACALTGHRPANFSFKYNENDEKCLKIKELLREQISALITEGVTDFYSGMALGADQWAAEIVLDMKKKCPSLRLIAVLPCETQANNWTAEQRKQYLDTLARCDETVTLHKQYVRSCYHERNRYLVDHAEYLLAVYDGGDKSGTACTVKYGKQKQRKIIIIDPNKLEIRM